MGHKKILRGPGHGQGVRAYLELTGALVLSSFSKLWLTVTILDDVKMSTFEPVGEMLWCYHSNEASLNWKNACLILFFSHLDLNKSILTSCFSL